MTRFSQAARVGAFSVITVAGAYLIFDFVNRGSDSGEGYAVYALLNDATGIVKYSHVRVAGIPIGSIEKVSLDGRQARVDIRIKEDIKLYRDATASRVSKSLLGEYTLQVSPGTEGGALLKDGDRIDVASESVSTDDILSEVHEIAKDLRKVSESLTRSIGSQEGEDDIKSTLHHLAEVTEALNETVKENRKSVRSILLTMERVSAKSEPEVERIMENVRVTTEEVRQLVEKSKEPGSEGGEVREIISKVNNASTSLESALADIETVADRLEKGEGTLGRLSRDEKLINEVEGIAEGVGDFVGGLNRMRTVVSLRSEYQTLAQTVKSYVEIRLQPREDKYYSFELISDPRGRVYIEQVDVSTTNPNDPPQYREVRTTTTNDYRFSFQFAQRWGPFWGRFGVKESTGGVGLDTVLFEDRFELRQDLYAFGEASVPRYRVFLGYEFLHRLWVMGGVDDILSNTRRDYFFGLQLRFDDRDLKNLVPFAGGL